MAFLKPNQRTAVHVNKFWRYLKYFCRHKKTMHWHVPEVNRNVFARLEICNFPRDKQDGALTFFSGSPIHFCTANLFFYFWFTKTYLVMQGMYLKMNNMKEKTGEKSVFNVKYMWWITEHIVKIENTEVRNAALVALGASWESRTVGRSSIFLSLQILCCFN